MDAERFELTVSVSHDPRLAGAVRDLVVCAAQYAGCPSSAAAAFASDVERAVRDTLSVVAAGTMLPITVRRDRGPVEVLVDGHTLTLDV
jgi:hypothetical protein